LANIRLQKEPIDIATESDRLRSPFVGGIVTFSGTVREWTGDQQTVAIDYTVYEGMAQKEMQRLVEEIHTKELSITLIHRIGRLQPMETAVFIGVAAPHRQAAFVACEYIIDRLKERVPIWKKEIAPNLAQEDI
jgi:molybdopterin synthase catalytic subunit